MRVLIASNRLPFTVEVKEEQLRFRRSSGGLVSGLSSYLDTVKASNEMEHIWVAWPGSTIPEQYRKQLATRALTEYQSYPVYLSETAMEKFYHGFCNKTIWPLFHYFPSYTIYEQDYWKHYQSVNEKFRDAIVEIAQPDDIIWVHDYHLMLLPRLLREKLPDAEIGFFLHIPFPSFEVFRMLPAEWRAKILEGLLGADLVGFHTHNYTEYFLRCVLRVLGYEQSMGQVPLKDRIVAAETFPMGIDFKKYSDLTVRPEIQEERKKLRDRFPDQTVILSLDRLDYTKGILNRLQGYELFLEKHSEYRNRVVLLLIVVPSRIAVEHYQTMKSRIDELVGRINGKYGNLGWTPIIYQFRSLTLNQLVAVYAASDIALITPLRDGMNLIAKEYLACRRDGTGVLILSEMAGASSELGESLMINPNYAEEIASMLLQALQMPREEQIQRNQSMQKRLQRYNVNRWASDFLDKLHSTKELQQSTIAARLTNTARLQIISDYERANRRLLLLDYDGTLVPFTLKPEDARPGAALLEILKRLAHHAGTDLVLVTGRGRCALDSWFDNLGAVLIAEHGMLIRESGKDWTITIQVASDWKPQIIPILELYVDRVPGSMIEEKEFSLSWHYRKADPVLGSLRSKELMDHLMHITTNLNLQVLSGNKVVELRNAGINKGTASANWLRRDNFDFVLAVGYDWMDEDLFRGLPPQAHTIKVGLGRQSSARWNVHSHNEIVQLLQELASAGASVSDTVSFNRT